MMSPIAPRESNPPEIALVLKGYPRLSETFHRPGDPRAGATRSRDRNRLAPPSLRSLDPPDPRADRSVRPLFARISLSGTAPRASRLVAGAPLAPLPDALVALAKRISAGTWTANRVRRFGQALVFAAEMPESIRLIYVHYLHTPASVARYAALLKGLPYSMSAHAKDIWTSPDWELREKLEDCRWLTTCTRVNRQHLSSLAPDAEVFLTYHGLDALRFPSPDATVWDRMAARPDATGAATWAWPGWWRKRAWIHCWRP